MKKSGYMSGAAGRGRGMALAAGMLLAVMQMYAQPKVVGHRGCRFNTPDDPGTLLYENTLPALGFAQELGVDAVEFDVQLTSDGKVIVFHGPEVPVTGKDIRKITFAQARGTVLPGGHRMPELRFCRGCPAVAYGTNGNFYGADPQCWKTTSHAAQEA